MIIHIKYPFLKYFFSILNFKIKNINLKAKKSMKILYKTIFLIKKEFLMKNNLNLF
jgi:hypothetical protein